MFTLLELILVTLGMMCLVITAISTLVLKVLGIPRSLLIMLYDAQLARHSTTLNKDVAQDDGPSRKKKSRH